MGQPAYTVASSVRQQPCHLRRGLAHVQARLKLGKEVGQHPVDQAAGRSHQEIRQQTVEPRQQEIPDTLPSAVTVPASDTLTTAACAEPDVWRYTTRSLVCCGTSCASTASEVIASR